MHQKYFFNIPLTDDMVVDKIAKIFESFSDIQSKAAYFIYSAIQTLWNSWWTQAL